MNGSRRLWVAIMSLFWAPARTDPNAPYGKAYNEGVWFVYREIMWTEDSEDHIARHGILPGEVEELVNSRPIYSAPGREETTLVYGVTGAGRHLLAVLIEVVDGRWLVVTAREMTPTETRSFRPKGR